jgi:hypothetical protein
MDKAKTLSLKIFVADMNQTHVVQLNPTTIVFDALRILRENIAEANTNDGNL